MYAASGSMSFMTFKMASAVNMCCIRAIPNYSFTRIVANNCLFSGVAKFSRSASSICLKKTRASVLAQISYGGGMSPAFSGLWSALPKTIGNLNTRCGFCPSGFGHAMSYSTQKPSLAEEVMKAKLPPAPPPEPPLGKEEPKDQQKKDSWFSGKNAWKFGLASLAVMGVMMCGNILVLWGMASVRLLSDIVTKPP